QVYNGNQTYLTDIMVSGGISAGQTKTLSSTITIPCTYPTGTKYILAGADATNVILESNESDNNLSFGILLHTVAIPANPTSNSPQSGSVAITRSGSPPPGEVWYWQNTSCGTSTGYGSGSTYNATASGTYYIRSQNTACG